VKTYVCRLIVDGKIAEIGIVCAESKAQLFRVIDQFADPDCYDIAETQPGDAVFFPVAQWIPDVVEVENGEVHMLSNDDFTEDHTRNLAEKGPYISEEIADRRPWRTAREFFNLKR
jgi:hypothetical protein